MSSYPTPDDEESRTVTREVEVEEREPSLPSGVGVYDRPPERRLSPMLIGLILLLVAVGVILALYVF